MPASASPALNGLDGCCPSSTAPAELTVAQLARTVGTKPDTIRYYERAGLLPPPARTPAEHRRYDGAAVDRLRFIRGAQRLGLRLSEIKTLLAVRDTGTCPCEPAEELLRQHIDDVDAELARLGSLRAELLVMADALAAAVQAPQGVDCPDPLPGTWCPPAMSESGRR